MQKATMDYNDVEERLRQAGIQPTAQRIAICQYVLTQKDHASVEDVKKWVDHHIPKVSLATVYNTINLLVDHHLIQAIKVPGSDRIHYDSNSKSHAHFYDQDADEIFDLPDDAINVDVNVDDIEVDNVQVLIIGKRKS